MRRGLPWTGSLVALLVTGCFNPDPVPAETDTEAPPPGTTADPLPPATGTTGTGDPPASTGSTTEPVADSGSTTEPTATSGSTGDTGTPGDMDGDEVPDDIDNCPADANPDQLDDDGDEVGNECDNCVSVDNPAQEDLDADDVGDFCDAEVIDIPQRLYVPVGVVHPMAGSSCYSGEIRIYGTVEVIEPGGGVPGAGTLQLRSETSLWVADTGQIDGAGAGNRGGLSAPSNGGMAGLGAAPGCGGGPGSAVANGGSGGGYGGVGGTADSTTPYAMGNQCSLCSQAPEAHCYGLPGPLTGTAGDVDLDMGSGGGSGGNSSGCMNTGGNGGAGGAAVWLLANEAVRIDGVVSVDGQTPPVDGSVCGYRPGGGGGSGGGLILAADVVDGGPMGLLSARGGDGGEALGDTSSTWGWGGGGGGGGRIKIFAVTDDLQGTLAVGGGVGGAAPADPSSYAGFPGDVGTVSSQGVIPPVLVVSCN